MSLISRLIRQISGPSRSHRARRRREPFSPFGIQAAQVETLENRRLLSALTVTTAADSGAGSLRAEIAAANSGDTINFASSLKGQTIALTGGELLINKGLTIQGPGAAQLTISGGTHSRVFDVASSQPVVLAGLTISNGASGGGAGITNAAGSNLTVSACTISSCHATGAGGFGGGIVNSGILTLSGSTVSGDSASSAGGGILNVGTLTATNCTVSSNNCTAPSNLARGVIGGGGIYNTGSLRASGCTFSGNGVNFYGRGGGIYFRAGQASLTNCTIAGNSAGGGDAGGGVADAGGGAYVAGGSGVVMTDCTISLNQAFASGGSGGGIGIASSGGFPPAALELNNTIVAGNTVRIGPASSEQFNGADIMGTVSSSPDHNLIGNGAGCNITNGHGNIVGSRSHVINALLGPLQDNGGPTMTMALLAGSPAIGHADNFVAPATDQRGVTRRDLPGKLTDIGAYEL